GTALAPAQHVEADVCCDALEPRAQCCAAFERVEATPRADERLLHRVLGFERRAEHAVAVPRELGPVLLELSFDVVRREIDHPGMLDVQLGLLERIAASASAAQRTVNR